MLKDSSALTLSELHVCVLGGPEGVQRGSRGGPECFKLHVFFSPVKTDKKKKREPLVEKLLYSTPGWSEAAAVG